MGLQPRGAISEGAYNQGAYNQQFAVYQHLWTFINVPFTWPIFSSNLHDIPNKIEFISNKKNVSSYRVNWITKNISVGVFRTDKAVA